MAFDFDAYLASKDSANQKLQSVMEASKAKVAELEAFNATKPQAENPSWTKQLGLEPGSFIGNRVNDLASLVSGATRLVGDVAALPSNIDAIAPTFQSSAADVEAYNRVKTNKALPGDVEQLQRRNGPQAPTVLEMFQQSEKSRATGQTIDAAADFSSIVDKSNRQGLSADLAQGFGENWGKVTSGEAGQVVGGLAGLLVNAGSAIVNNPSAIREYIIENAPQLLVGAVGKVGQGVMAASNVGYAVDEFNKGMQAELQRTGTLPSLERQQEMALQAASLALAEQAGDLIGLHGAGAIGKAGTKTSLKNVGKAVGEGVLGEAPTEGFQTYMEGRIKGKPATPGEIYEAAVIGGASGGGLSGGGRAVAELAKATPEYAAERADALKTVMSKEAAIQSGDVSVMLDPKSKGYSPAEAIAVLHGNSKLDTSDDAKKAANLKQADEILTDLNKQRQALSVAAMGAEQKQAHIDKMRAALAAADPTDTEGIQAYKDEITTSEKELKSIDPKATKDAQQKLARMDAELSQARQNRDQLGFLLNSQESIDTNVGVLKDTTKVAEHKDAADKIITLAMEAPDRLDPKVASELAEDTNNGLSTEQRTYLRSFNESRIAANALMKLGDVSKAIYTGYTKKNGQHDVGLAEYRSGIAASIAASDRRSALIQMTALQSFETSHVGKAAAYAKAIAIGKGTQIHKVKGGGWVVATGADAFQGTPAQIEAQLRKNGGLSVTSEQFSGNLAVEADAISKTAAEMRLAISLKFTKTAVAKAGAQPQAEATQAHIKTVETPTVTGASDVKDTTQQRSGTAEKPKAPVVQDAAPAGESSDAGKAGVVSGEEVAPEPKTPAVPPARDTQMKGTSGSFESKTAVDSQDRSTESSSKSSVYNQSNSENTTESEVTGEQGTAGALASLAEKSPEGTAFKAKKLGDFVKQTPAKDDAATARPLVAVKDFLSKLASGEVSVATYLGFAPNESYGQDKAIEMFIAFAKALTPQIRSNLFQGDSNYFYNDWAQALVSKVDGKLDIDENVRTAIAYAVMGWVAENATRTQLNDDAEINAILGRDETHPVDDDERTALGHVGSRQNLVINTLGQRITQALGMRAVKDAPANILPDLQAALGAHALKAMVDMGLIVRDTIDGSAMAELTGKEDTSTEANNYFIRVNDDVESKGGSRVDKITGTLIGTQGVLDKLFGVESGLKEPSFEKVEFTQKTTKNTQQKVPPKLAEAVNHDNSRPFMVRRSMWALWQQLSQDSLLEISGAEDLDKKHAANERSTKAKNDGLLREIQNVTRFVGKMFETDEELNQELYFEHTVWKQQRVGIATNVLNPQSSKVARHMLTRAGWSTEVDASSAKSMDSFKLRVLEGLGVKTDKQGNKKSLVGFNAMFDPKLAKSDKDESNAKTLNAGVRVLVEVLEGKEMTPEKEQLLVAAVLKGGENMHSLDALMAVAEWKFAEKSTKPGQAVKFTTQLMGEVDGVTNGPMLSHLLMGAANSVKELFSLLNRGGFFEKGNAHSQYNLWRSVTGHRDLYENTASNMTAVVQRFIRDGIPTSKGKIVPWSTKGQLAGVMNAVYAFTGELSTSDGKVTKDGRNIIKTPLTAMVFGSSVDKAVSSMANKFIESIYAKIEDSAAGKPGSLSASEIVDHVNRLLRIGSFKQGDGYDTAAPLPYLEIDKLLARPLSASQITGLKSAFTKTLGKAVSEVIASDFASYIGKRQTFNDAAQLAFVLHEAAYTSMRDQLLNELMDNGKIPFYDMADTARNAAERPKYESLGFRVPLHDLTAEQEQELRSRVRKVNPVMHSYMSKESGSLASGLAIAKTQRKLGERAMYRGQVKFGSAFSDYKQSSTMVKAFETTQSSPSVGMVPISTHSADSAVSHLALMGTDALNVHDAHGTGVGSFEDTAKRLNQSLWSVMMGYSPAHEMSMALSRTVQGIAQLAATGMLSPAALQKLSGVIADMAIKREMDPGAYLQVMFQDMRATAANADRIKYGTLAAMQSVDQYALEGGNYEVTNEDRDQAAALRKQVSSEISAEEQAALDAIDSALAKRNSGSATEEEISGSTLRKASAGRKGEADISNESAAASNKTLDGGATEGFALGANPESAADSSPFGPLGKSSRNSPEIAAFFEANPKSTAKAVIKFLFEHLATHPEAPNRDYSAKLLRKLQTILPANLPIELVTATTALSDVLAKHNNPAHSWYVPPQNGKTEQAIYVMGPEFEVSALKFEVLLHEMVHAATHIKLHSPQGKVYQAELQALLEKAREYVAAEKLTGYDTKLSNVDELIAYGMTNQKFQQEVLAKVQFTSTITKTNTSALKAFVTTLSRLLGFNTTVEANGLGALMANVAGILAIADTQTSEGTTTLAMSPEANTYSTMDILNGLSDGSVGPAFQLYLREILGGVVQTLHGPFGSLKAELMENTTNTPMDVWNKALATGKAPFASKILASPFKVSNQEAFAIEQVEATVLSALNASEARTKMAYRELTDLYQEVYRSTKVQDFSNGDWTTATADEKQRATDLHDFVFKIEKNNGDRSNYLARFAALGLANQGFNRVLKRATERSGRQASSAKSFADRLQELFEDILGFFRSRVTKTYAGQNADVKLRTLVEQLVDIEQKSRMRLATEGAKSSLAESIEQSLKKVNDSAGQAIQKVVNSAFIQKSGSGIIRGAGAVARTAIGGRVDQVLDLLGKMRDEHLDERHGVLASLIGEAKGPNEQMKFALLGAKHNETVRKRVIESASNTALGEFIDGGERLTPEQKAAVSQAFLRSGAHALLGSFTAAQIEDLVSNPAKLTAAITQHESQLKGNAKGYWLHQARALGYYKATGKVTSQLLMTNAGNIAKMLGTKYVGKLSDAQVSAAEATLHPLVSLYALSYLSPAVLDNAAVVLKAENARTDGNGVEFVLKLHQRLEQESQARLFKSSPELMMHGYTPEILNPHTEVQIANAVEGKELEDRGWSKGSEVPLDPADPDRERRYMYVLRGAGLGARQTGIVSWLNLNSKGTKKHSGYTNPNNANGLANAQLNAGVLTARQSSVQKMFTSGATFDPTKVGTTYMAPVINPAGDITTWRYMMQEQTKDALLERDNRFEHILGALAGSIFDKETSVEQNSKAMQMLKDQYDAEFSKESKRYIEISATSPHKELREIWALLPDSAKKDIRKIWGRDSIYVRKDSVDIVFGYRKLSVATMFHDSLDARKDLADMGMGARIQDLDNDEFGTLQKLAIMTVETLLTVQGRINGMNQKDAEAYSKRAAVVMTRAGRMWSEVVAETKDLIVVKTGVVLLDNIWSNISMLVLSGVPIKDILHHHMVALKGATTYHADVADLERLRLLKAAGHTMGQDKEIQREITRLEDSITRNPITKLVDAGLMPTIVEDIANEDDIYSYKSALVKKTDAITSNVPELFKSAAKTIYMTHDTPLYQGLSRVTQLSDFVARYTMYQHLITRKIGPMTEKEALSRSIDSFIMYDVPMHPLLQYADDSGLFMFTKYFLRIQRVLRTLWHENPARVAAGMLLDSTIGLGPIVLDSAAMFRIGNPLDVGAFKIFGSLDELATVKPVISLMGGGRGW